MVDIYLLGNIENLKSIILRVYMCIMLYFNDVIKSLYIIII